MYFFPHEKLDCYVCARDVATWLDGISNWPAGKANLKDQAIRAADSVTLNIAEGTCRSKKSRAHHYRIAQGSAAELCACLDRLDLEGKEEQQDKLRRIGAMLANMR